MCEGNSSFTYFSPGSKRRETLPTASEALAAHRHLFEGLSLGVSRQASRPEKRRPVRNGRTLAASVGIPEASPASRCSKPVREGDVAHPDPAFRFHLPDQLASRRHASTMELRTAFFVASEANPAPCVKENLITGERVEPTLRSRRTPQGWLPGCLKNAACTTFLDQASKTLTPLPRF